MIFIFINTILTNVVTSIKRVSFTFYFEKSFLNCDEKGSKKEKISQICKNITIILNHIKKISECMEFRTSEDHPIQVRDIFLHFFAFKLSIMEKKNFYRKNVIDRVWFRLFCIFIIIIFTFCSSSLINLCLHR